MINRQIKRHFDGELRKGDRNRIELNENHAQQNNPNKRRSEKKKKHTHTAATTDENNRRHTRTHDTEIVSIQR